MSRAIRLLLVMILAVAVGLFTPVAARADDKTPITRFHATVELDEDGDADVTLDFTMDFSQVRGRGPIIVLPTRQAAGDRNDLRFDYVGFLWSSPTGADVTVHREDAARTIAMRVGEENTWYDTPQDYTLTYTVRGLIDTDNAESGLDEFNWDAIGTGWDLPISNVSAEVHGPAPIEAAYCHHGRTLDDPCEATPSGTGATFSSPDLAPHEAFQVTASYPSGTFPGVDVNLVERPGPRTWFRPTPASLGLGGALLAVALVVLYAVRRGQRDEIFVDLPPGMLPAGGTSGRIGPAPRKRPVVAVAFTPPDASPAEIGVLMDGRVDALELSSTLVDLAARRLIAIESAGSGFRFTLLQQPPGTRLKNYESSLLATMFGSGTVVTSAELNKNRKAGQRFVKLLDEAVRAKGWMIRQGRTGSVGLRGAGVMITWLGLMFTAFVAAFGFALAGLPILLLGVGLFVLSFKRASYKAKGSAVRAQADAFKLYLSTAERDTLRFEEGVEIFSRYLPYAMVFGVADRWAGLFESLAREGVYRADTSWYHGSDISRASGFAGSMSSLSTSLSSVTRSAVSSGVGGGTRGSSGGSGSSGGGGMGGSGGSSW